MTDEMQTWNLRPEQWTALLARVAGSSDALEDGALVRTGRDEETGTEELHFFATPLNRPIGWSYPFLEEVPGSAQRGAFIGRAWHETETGFVQFEVFLVAAAQALTADFESGAADLDDVAYEQAVERAVRGTERETQWLREEFARLVTVSGA